jgi:hypothetical protein
MHVMLTNCDQCDNSVDELRSEFPWWFSHDGKLMEYKMNYEELTKFYERREAIMEPKKTFCALTENGWLCGLCLAALPDKERSDPCN